MMFVSLFALSGETMFLSVRSAIFSSSCHFYFCDDDVDDVIMIILTRV